MMGSIGEIDVNQGHVYLHIVIPPKHADYNLIAEW